MFRERPAANADAAARFREEVGPWPRLYKPGNPVFSSVFRNEDLGLMPRRDSKGVVFIMCHIIDIERRSGTEPTITCAAGRSPFFRFADADARFAQDMPEKPGVGAPWFRVTQRTAGCIPCHSPMATMIMAVEVECFKKPQPKAKKRVQLPKFHILAVHRTVMAPLTPTSWWFMLTLYKSYFRLAPGIYLEKIGDLKNLEGVPFPFLALKWLRKYFPKLEWLVNFVHYPPAYFELVSLGVDPTILRAVMILYTQGDAGAATVRSIVDGSHSQYDTVLRTDPSDVPQAPPQHAEAHAGAGVGAGAGAEVGEDGHGPAAPVLTAADALAKVVGEPGGVALGDAHASVTNDENETNEQTRALASQSSGSNSTFNLMAAHPDAAYASDLLRTPTRDLAQALGRSEDTPLDHARSHVAMGAGLVDFTTLLGMNLAENIGPGRDTALDLNRLQLAFLSGEASLVLQHFHAERKADKWAALRCAMYYSNQETSEENKWDGRVLPPGLRFLDNFSIRAFCFVVTAAHALRMAISVMDHSRVPIVTLPLSQAYQAQVGRYAVAYTANGSGMRFEAVQSRVLSLDKSLQENIQDRAASDGRRRTWSMTSCNVNMVPATVIRMNSDIARYLALVPTNIVPLGTHHRLFLPAIVAWLDLMAKLRMPVSDTPEESLDPDAVRFATEGIGMDTFTEGVGRVGCGSLWPPPFKPAIRRSSRMPTHQAPMHRRLILVPDRSFRIYLTNVLPMVMRNNLPSVSVYTIEDFATGRATMTGVWSVALVDVHACTVDTVHAGLAAVFSRMHVYSLMVMGDPMQSPTRISAHSFRQRAVPQYSLMRALHVVSDRITPKVWREDMARRMQRFHAPCRPFAVLQGEHADIFNYLEPETLHPARALCRKEILGHATPYVQSLGSGSCRGASLPPNLKSKVRFAGAIGSLETRIKKYLPATYRALRTKYPFDYVPVFARPQQAGLVYKHLRPEMYKALQARSKVLCGMGQKDATLTKTRITYANGAMAQEGDFVLYRQTQLYIVTRVRPTAATVGTKEERAREERRMKVKVKRLHQSTRPTPPYRVYGVQCDLQGTVKSMLGMNPTRAKEGVFRRERELKSCTPVSIITPGNGLRERIVPASIFVFTAETSYFDILKVLSRTRYEVHFVGPVRTFWRILRMAQTEHTIFPTFAHPILPAKPEVCFPMPDERERERNPKRPREAKDAAGSAGSAGAGGTQTQASAAAAPGHGGPKVRFASTRQVVMFSGPPRPVKRVRRTLSSCVTQPIGAR